MKPCAHHWIIDRVAGPQSRGVCQLCGAVQVFENHMPSRLRRLPARVANIFYDGRVTTLREHEAAKGKV